MLNVESINAMSEVQAHVALLTCCGAARWAQQMMQRRPFADGASVLAAAQEIWWNLASTDWQEAFAAHPRIGDLKTLRSKFAATAAEQAGVAHAAEATLQALAEANHAYEARFGYIFIVCATGKSADEMLALLRQRLGNNREEELRIAAAEQEKITRIRLERLAS
jgi:2-oxo-4-hydroxy-4-carboxy-5-ureidoimidazoline decarboxylase